MQQIQQPYQLKSVKECLSLIQATSLYKGEQAQYQNLVTVEREKIAKGGYSVVHAGIYNPSNIKIAIKIYTTNQDVDCSDILQEVQNLNRIRKDFSYIIRCIGIFAWISRLAAGEILEAIVIFPLAHGDLQKIIESNRVLSEFETEEMLEQILSALRYLKNQFKIIHRDIKPANILILEDGTYCLTDFGISKLLEMDQGNPIVSAKRLETLKVNAGTLAYFAPEVLNLWNQPLNYQPSQINSINVEKADIYSLGVTCLQVLFNLRENDLMTMNIQNGQLVINQKLVMIQNPRLKQTLTGMLREKKEDRFGISQSLSCLISDGQVESINEIDFKAQQAENQSLKQDILSFQIIIADKEDKINKLQAQLDRTKDQMAQAQLQQEKQIFSLKQEQNSLLAQIREYQQEIEGLKLMHIEEKNAQNKQFLENIEVLKSQLVENQKAAQQEIDELKREKEQLHLQTEEQKLQIQQQKNDKIDSYEEQIELLKKQIEVINLQLNQESSQDIFSSAESDTSSPSLARHLKQVLSVAFSPDGIYLASGSSDHKIKLWNAQTTQLVDTLEGHTDTVFQVSFQPSGKLLASGSADSTVILWDVQSREQIHQFVKHNNTVYSVVFSPDGQTLASGDGLGQIILWNVPDKKKIKPLELHIKPIQALAFSADGQFLASGSIDTNIIVWNLSTRKSLRVLQNKNKSIPLSIAFSPDCNVLASGYNDGSIFIWKLKNETISPELLQEHAKSVNSVAFSPDGRLLVSGSDDKNIVIWLMKDNSVFKKFVGHKKTVHSVAISPDSKLLASGSEDCTVKLWTLE